MSRQNYYKLRQNRIKQEVASDTILDMVHKERREQPALGCRKLLKLICPHLDEETRIGRDRMFKLLRDNDLLISRKRKYCRTTNSNHNYNVYRNLLKDMNVTGSNQAFVSDITYISTMEGFMYLALVMDAHSRQIVGYDCSDSLESLGALRALRMALRQLPKGVKIVHHSDRGCQYCCREYVKLLKRHGISMTEENHCYENGKAERLNGILKQEYGLGKLFKNKNDVKRAVVEAVYYYNYRRPHQALGYKIPVKVHKAA